MSEKWPVRVVAQRLSVCLLRANNNEQRELTSVEIKQAFAQAECRAGLVKPICEQYKFRRQRRQNTAHVPEHLQAFAGSQLKCDEGDKDGERLLRLAVRPIISDVPLSLPSCAPERNDEPRRHSESAEV